MSLLITILQNDIIRWPYLNPRKKPFWIYAFTQPLRHARQDHFLADYKWFEFRVLLLLDSLS